MHFFETLDLKFMELFKFRHHNYSYGVMQEMLLMEKNWNGSHVEDVISDNEFKNSGCSMRITGGVGGNDDDEKTCNTVVVVMPLT